MMFNVSFLVVHSVHDVRNTKFIAKLKTRKFSGTPWGIQPIKIDMDSKYHYKNTLSVGNGFTHSPTYRESKVPTKPSQPAPVTDCKIKHPL